MNLPSSPYPHIPVNKGMLGINMVKLVVQISPGLSNGCGVAQHAHSLLCLSKDSTIYYNGRLIINPNLIISGAPIHKVQGILVLLMTMAAFTSLRATLPWYHRQWTMYLPWQESHFTIWLAVSKQALVQEVVCGRLFQQRSQQHMWPEGSECRIRTPFRVQWNLREVVMEWTQNLTYQLVQVSVVLALSIKVFIMNVIDDLIIYHVSIKTALHKF